MVVYTLDSVSKYHLSPYVRVIGTPNGVELHQTLFGERCFLQIAPDQAKALLDRLSTGCTKEQAQEIMHACFGKYADDILKHLLLGGFIE